MEYTCPKQMHKTVMCREFYWGSGHSEEGYNIAELANKHTNTINYLINNVH